MSCVMQDDMNQPGVPSAMSDLLQQYVLDLSVLNDYTLDLAYAQTWISRYKDLIWLVLTLFSSLIVVYGILLPQRNNAKQRKQEATLSLIDRWTAHEIPYALLAYQNQVGKAGAKPVQSESKTKLYSFFHTVALLIREKKVDEALLQKSQIAMGFLCFYATLLIEQPDLLNNPTYYGREFQALHRRWKHMVKRYGKADFDMDRVNQPWIDANRIVEAAKASAGSESSEAPAGEKRPHLQIVPRA